MLDSEIGRGMRARALELLQDATDEESRQLQNFAARARNTLDISGKLDMEKQRIERQREDLERVQRAVSGLQNGWSNVRPDS